MAKKLSVIIHDLDEEADIEIKEESQLDEPTIVKALGGNTDTHKEVFKLVCEEKDIITMGSVIGEPKWN